MGAEQLNDLAVLKRLRTYLQNSLSQRKMEQPV